MTERALARASALIHCCVMTATRSALVVGSVATVVHDGRLLNVEEAQVLVPLIALGRKHEVAVPALHRLAVLRRSMTFALVFKTRRLGAALL